jgi:hypothetical protein
MTRSRGNPGTGFCLKEGTASSPDPEIHPYAKKMDPGVNRA